MSKNKELKLLEHPDYNYIVRRYAYNIVRFSVEVFGYKPTPHQENLYHSTQLLGSRTSVSSGHGCFAKGTKIMRSTGKSVAVEYITIGDRLMGDSGNSYRNVIGLCRGRENMFRFTYSDGSSHVFNGSHILCLVATNSKGRRKTGDKITVIVRDWLKWGRDKKRCHAIYRKDVSEFENQSSNFLIPPYMMGAWLGDGHSHSFMITTMDEEIVREITALADSINMLVSKHKSKSSGKANTYNIKEKTTGRGYKNRLKNELERLGVLNNKHIPDCYLYASKKDRLELFAGLIDTDGHYDKNSSGYEITQKNKQLAEQIMWLARSIGCHATVKSVIKKCTNTGVSGEYHKVTIGRNVSQTPVRIGIKSVEALGEGDYYGFELDGNHKFLGSDFTVLHNTGKTFSFALIALWHLVFYQKSNTFITAPKLDTVKDGVWKEFADHHEAMINNGFEWLANYIIIEAKKVFIKDYKLNWFVIPKSAPRGSPTNIAGTHRTSLLWLADEASGIPSPNFGVIGGSLTEGDRNRFLIASQPTQPSGFFYDTHHKLSVKNGGVWTSLVFNSEHSPRVSYAFLREKLLEYGGRNSPEYSIKVLGEFPDKAEGFLLGRSEIEAAFGGSCVFDADHWGWLLSSDIGGGNYRDDSTLLRAKVIGNGDYEYSEDGEAREARRVHVLSVPLCTNTKNPVQFSGAVYQYMIEAGLIADHILIDKGGGGDTVCYNLEQKGVPMVTPVIWGKPCFKNKSKERFRNQRAQCNASAARAVRENRLTFDKSIPQDIVTKIVDQASRIPFFFDEYQRVQIKSKKDMAEDGLPSPDLWDSVAQLFLEGAFYTPNGSGVTQFDDAKQAAIDEMIKEGEYAFDDA